MNWIFGYFGVACKSVYFIKIFMFLKLNFWILRIFGFWDFIDFLDFSLELLFQSRYHESCQNQGILDFFKILTISLFASNSRIFGFFFVKYFSVSWLMSKSRIFGFFQFFFLINSLHQIPRNFGFSLKIFLQSSEWLISESRISGFFQNSIYLTFS